MEPKASIITCTIRRHTGIAEFIDSLNLQTRMDFELIFVDGRYPERSSRIRNELSALDSPFAYVYDKPVKDRGRTFALANARNTGIIHSKAEICIFTDDNITFEPDVVERHIRHHAKFPHSSLAGAVEYDSGDGIKSGSDPRLQWMGERTHLIEDLGNLIPPEWLYGMNASIPIEALLEINGYDERYCGEFGGEDCNAGIRLARAGYKVYFDINCLVHENKVRDRHSNIFDEFGLEHETWYDEVTGKSYWRNERFTQELIRGDMNVFKANPHLDLREMREAALRGE